MDKSGRRYQREQRADGLGALLPRRDDLEPPPQVDAIILQADHDEYRSMDFGAFRGCRVVLDGRNALPREDVEAKGMRYIAIGR